MQIKKTVRFNQVGSWILNRIQFKESHFTIMIYDIGEVREFLIQYSKGKSKFVYKSCYKKSFSL